MTKLYFKVEDVVFTTLKDAKAYQTEISTDDFWGIPKIEQICVEENCTPHGVSKFEEFTNPKLKIRG